MKFNEINIDKKHLLLHVLFWLVWIVAFTFIQSIGSNIRQYFVWLMYYVITFPIFVLHTYLLAYWLIPKTFFKRKYFFAFLGIVVFLIVFSIVELVVSNEIVFRFFNKQMMFEPGYLNIKNIIISGIGNHYIILVFLAIKAGTTWYSAQNEKEELLQLKTETEMEIYRYQLQPKLILTLVEELEIISKTDAGKMPEMIIKISNFLNHFLYEGKEDFIPLSQDVKLLEEFLEIHKYALGNRFINNFTVTGKLQPFVVQPLLLLPYMNGAIKIAYQCNNSFENSVIIKAERKYLLLTYTFWSEQPFRFVDDADTIITRKRLKSGFHGKHRLTENVDENFVEIILEIFK